VDRPLDVPAVEQLKCEIMEFQPGLTDPSHGVRVMVSLLMLRFLLADSCAYSHWRLVSGFDSICSLRDLQIRAVAPPAAAAAAAAVVIPRLSAAQIVEPPRPLSGEPVLPVPRRAVPVSKEAVMKPKREIDGGSGGERFKVSFKLRMLGPGLCKPRSMAQKQRRRRSMLGEVEEAAVLLMALSSGFLHA
ncbi:hypothetical protein GW17_00018273, partial [Ensete ventricosum]